MILCVFSCFIYTKEYTYKVSIQHLMYDMSLHQNPLAVLPAHAHFLFEDLENLAAANNRHVVAVRVRDDGSIVLANRRFWDRLIVWFRTAVVGLRDEASVQVNLLLAQQLRHARGGLHAIAATDQLGVAQLPLRNRDLQVVVQTLLRHCPSDHAATLELRDGYVVNTMLGFKRPRGLAQRAPGLVVAHS